MQHAIEKKMCLTYPSFRGVDGGVHGELPSLYDPPNEAPCRLRTAFNKLIVELLRPYLNDWVTARHDDNDFVIVKIRAKLERKNKIMKNWSGIMVFYCALL